MFPSSRRPLLRALTVSVLIHAALLLSAVRVFVPPLEMPATTINVAIRSSDRRDTAPAVAASTPAANPLPAPEARPAPMVRETLERPAEPPAVAPAPPASGAAASAAPLPASSPPSPKPVAPAGSAAPAARGATSTTGATSVPGVPSVTPVPARPGVSADDLRQYSMSLGIAARRFKRYPALARERGWEGRAEVALIFSVVLPLPEVVLTRSSGRTVLDEQAVEMMTQASRVTSLPEGLKGRDFRFSKAVEFSLENDQ